MNLTHRFVLNVLVLKKKTKHILIIWQFAGLPIEVIVNIIGLEIGYVREQLSLIYANLKSHVN